MSTNAAVRTSRKGCAPVAVPPDADPAAPASDAELAALCKALAHPVRLQILRFLARAETCYFGSIADALTVAPSTASQHLSILKEAGLVRGWADEQRSCYCIDPERLARLKALIQGL